MVRDFVPAYIREQILNAKPPDGCCVPEGSIPALAEGHFTSARAATVGINPHGSWNRNDFLPKERLTLDGDDLDEQFLNRVWEEKTRYFERKTYRYFTVLEPILRACGATYGGKYGIDRPDLACSLDLVQWPTDPLWSKLPKECSVDAQSKLLSDGAAFFEKILQENENLELLLGNGKTVVELIERTFKVRFDKWKVDELGVHVYCGDLMGKRFIGWTRFLVKFTDEQSPKSRVSTPRRRVESGGLPLGASIWLRYVVLCVSIPGMADFTFYLPVTVKPPTQRFVIQYRTAHQTRQNQEPSFFGINRHGKLRYSWAVGLGPFKPGRGS